MAVTYIDYTGNGISTTYAITFDRIKDAHVKVYVNKILITSGYTIVANNVVFDYAPAVGAAIRIRRQTDASVRLVDFVDGSRLNEDDLDTDSKQAFYLLQEAKDINDTSLIKGLDGKWNADNTAINSLPDPTAATEAATKQYVDNILSNVAAFGVQAPITRWALTGTGSQTVFTISGATLTNSGYYIVSVDGVIQDPASYTITANTITFSEAPPVGTQAIVVCIGYAKAAQTIPDGSVTTASISSSGIDTSVVNWSAITNWAPSTFYNKGDLVSYLGIAYRRSAAGTTGTTFNTGNWQQVSPSTTVPTDGSVTTAKIADGSITTAKLADSSVATNDIANGAVTAAKLGTNEQKQIAKAWVSFTTASGVPTVNSSYNIQSVARVGTTGVYTITFSTALADAAYAIVTSAGGAAAYNNTVFTSSLSTASFQFTVTNTSGVVNASNGTWSIVVFGN